jgi:hypothetical protein
MNNKNLFNKNLFYLGHNTMEEIQHPSYQHYIAYVKELQKYKNPIKPEYKEPIKPFVNFNQVGVNNLIHPGSYGPLNDEMLLVTLDNKFKQNQQRQSMKKIMQEDFNILFT